MKILEKESNPLQYSCLENPMDRGAWWAAVHRVAWSRTLLKRLSMHACIGEGNGNPLQCSCLENPRDRGAWWAAVYGITQSRTWLKWLNNMRIQILLGVSGKVGFGGKDSVIPRVQASLLSGPISNSQKLISKTRQFPREKALGSSQRPFYWCYSGPTCMFSLSAVSDSLGPHGL